ncbi:hypothetical protein AZE42_02198, partial [Rhizopogon vesiculosus]
MTRALILGLRATSNQLLRTPIPRHLHRLTELSTQSKKRKSTTANVGVSGRNIRIAYKKLSRRKVWASYLAKHGKRTPFVNHRHQMLLHHHDLLGLMHFEKTSEFSIALISTPPPCILSCRL